jgi:hypothetical protein
MTKAAAVSLNWDVDGDEVIKRPLPKVPKDASDETLRPLAVSTAHDEGYEVDAGSVVISR